MQFDVRLPRHGRVENFFDRTPRLMTVKLCPAHTMTRVYMLIITSAPGRATVKLPNAFCFDAYRADRNPG